MTEYCPGCHMVVAPKDPSRKPRGVAIWHGECLRKHDRVFTPKKEAPPKTVRPHHRVIWHGQS